MTDCDYLLWNATTIDRFGQQHQNQALVIQNGRFVWCGGVAALPEDYRTSAKRTEDCREKLITPGLIDCHTHLVYAGNRAGEFEQRLAGRSYAEIARAGGGIVSTVQQTRAASEEALIEQSLPRLQAMVSAGVLTVEIKSGYGLDLENELKILRVARRLGEITGIRVKTTFLGAHAIPPEYQGKHQAYVDYVCSDMIPAVAEAQLADSVDVFCESVGFTLAETEQIFTKAKALGLSIKCHAEQLSNLGASELAAQLGALSSDHIEYLDEAGVSAMAKAGTVAVLLPGAFYFLKEVRKPPVDWLRQAGVGMALATDCNPGTSPTTSLLLMMNMGCQLFSLTVAEAWSAVTYQAARALGIDAQVGSLAVGQVADLVRWPVTDAAQLCYQFGYPFQPETMIQGQWV